jgi:hypothetical protein
MSSGTKYGAYQLHITEPSCLAVLLAIRSIHPRQMSPLHSSVCFFDNYDPLFKILKESTEIMSFNFSDESYEWKESVRYGRWECCCNRSLASTVSLTKCFLTFYMQAWRSLRGRQKSRSKMLGEKQCLSSFRDPIYLSSLLLWERKLPRGVLGGRATMLMRTMLLLTLYLLHRHRPSSSHPTCFTRMFVHVTSELPFISGALIIAN